MVKPPGPRPPLAAQGRATLDLRGEVCPFTFVRTKLRLEELPLGAELTITVDHAPAAENVPRSLTGEGQEVVSVERDGPVWIIRAIKRREHRLLAKETHTR
jgi:tRNA 2-thiouridine synthesizing protein A